jgi:hypothetical protein
MYICIYVCMHACICVCVCTYVCMYVCLYVCTYVCMYIRMYVCLFHTFLYINFYVHAHIYNMNENHFIFNRFKSNKLLLQVTWSANKAANWHIHTCIHTLHFANPSHTPNNGYWVWNNSSVTKQKHDQHTVNSQIHQLKITNIYILNDIIIVK